MIGYVPDTFAAHFRTLDGQVGQIVTIYQFSSNLRKMAFLNINFGVWHANLFDKHIPRDKVLDRLVQISDGDDNSVVKEATVLFGYIFMEALLGSVI